MKKLIIAVSGGVDSVVLLDFLVNQKKLQNELIIAHFNHGIREDSEEDLKLVKKLAKKYNLKFEFAHGNLGEKTNEEKARRARYAFLRKLAKRYNAKIATAHHKDDILETIVINFRRGTGWRGIAVLDSADIWRPFLALSKQEIIRYANKKKLIWREDSTNNDLKYLRNKIRKDINAQNFLEKEKIFELWEKQIEIKREIDENVLKLAKSSEIYEKNKRGFQRYFFAQIEMLESIEILRQIVLNETGEILTRPQLSNFWLAIKTSKTGKKFDLGAKKSVFFTKTGFFF